MCVCVCVCVFERNKFLGTHNCSVALDGDRPYQVAPESIKKHVEYVQKFMYTLA
jgi:hypothetical protein